MNPGDIITSSRKPERPVLFVLNGLNIGGSEKKTVAVVNELSRTGSNVHLAYLDPRTQLLKSIDSGVPVVFLGRKGKISSNAIRKLHAYIVQEGIGKIICINVYPLLYAKAAAFFLRSESKPEIVLFENTTEHAGYVLRMYMRFFFRPLMQRADRIVFGCEAQKELWLRRYKLDERRCGIIYNGIDENFFAPGTNASGPGVPALEAGLNDSDFVVGAVGSLWRNKNHIELVSALNLLKGRLPNAKLVIAGDGPEREKIELAAKEEGLQARLSILGKIMDVRPFLDRIDVFVLPSISETFSNATLEAMSMKKPVIVSETGGMPEMVRDGVDGFLYRQGDPEQLASLILRLAANAETRRQIGENARRAVMERFTFARMADDYRDLLRGDDTKVS